MTTFLYGKGQILWDVTVNTAYVHPMNFLALGSRDMFEDHVWFEDRWMVASLCHE
jgi:hypothetical protein